jgi:branched-chain amino acid transport system substrate-binding protein
MKRISHSSSAILTIISIIMASLIIFSIGCSNKEEKEIKIGAILPLTGDNASYGIALKKGMDLAIDEINEKRINGKKLDVVFEDSQSDPQKAVNAFNKLVNADKVPMGNNLANRR